VLNSPIVYTTPTRNILKATELGNLAITDKILVPNGVCYIEGVHCVALTGTIQFVVGGK